MSREKYCRFRLHVQGKTGKKQTLLLLHLYSYTVYILHSTLYNNETWHRTEPVLYVICMYSVQIIQASFMPSFRLIFEQCAY